MKKLSRDQIDEAVHEIDGRYIDSTRAYYQRRWPSEYSNAAAYRGMHQGPTGFGQFFDDIDVNEEDPVEKHNIIRGIVRAAVATMLRSPPAPSMPSAHGDQRSLARSKATEGLCQAWTRNGVLDMEELERALSWAQQAGLGFIKPMFNPEAGDPVYSTEVPDEAFGWEEEEDRPTDIFGAEVPEMIAEGEIETTFVMSCDLLPDPAARRWRDVRYVFEVQSEPVYKLRERFPTDYFGEEPVFDPQGGFYRARQEMRTIQIDDEQSDHSELDDLSMAEIVQYWEKPSKTFPNGRFMVFSGSTVLWYGPNPLKPARLPYVPIYGPNIVPGSMYPDGQVEDLRAPQDTYDFVMSKMKEHADLMVNGRVLLPNGSGIDPDSIENRAGSVIQYNLPYKPENWAGQELPMSMIQYAQILSDRAKELGGYNDIAQGQIPNAEVSGRTIAFATERANLSREPDMVRFSRSIIDIYQHMIHLARQFYSDGRLIRSLGENQRWTLSVFRADDYEFRYQLVAEVYSKAPTSETLLLAETMEAKAAGLFDDDPASERARKMLGDHRVTRSTTDPWANHREKQRREIRLMTDDPMHYAEVDEIDEHDVHIEELVEFMVTPEFEALDPETQAKFRQHLYDHDLSRMMQFQDYSAQQQMLSSGPMQQEAAAPGMESPLDGGAENENYMQVPTVDDFITDPNAVQSMEQT